jgi:hypothetical protein
MVSEHSVTTHSVITHGVTTHGVTTHGVTTHGVRTHHATTHGVRTALQTRDTLTYWGLLSLPPSGLHVRTVYYVLNP